MHIGIEVNIEVWSAILVNHSSTWNNGFVPMLKT